MINYHSLVKLTQRLIRIDSQNPPGDESRIALYVGSYLKNLGLKVKIYEFRPKRSNVIAFLRGKGKKSLIVSPHLDTVPSGNNWSLDPFSAKIVKGKIYGLGATDCKCNLASLMVAIKSIVEEGSLLPYNLIFAATADEESGSTLGLRPLLKKGILRADEALVLDADDFEIIVAQKGLMHLKVKVRGKKAHGAYPDLGVNAIEASARVIADIKKLNINFKKSSYLKPPTVNTGTIKGGDKVNVVADWCEFELDFRFLPGMHHKRLLFRLRELLKKYARSFKIEIMGVQNPYIISEEHPLVCHLKKTFLHFKIKPKVKGSEGATVITFFKEEGIPAVATGFGVSSCAHTMDEYVKIANLYKGARAVEYFLKTYKF
ncbi:MAG: M20 family metallopeptidase [Candidatus Omnitrophota bacterium]